MDISIVIPLLNEDESLGELYRWIVKTLAPVIIPMRSFSSMMEVPTIHGK
jgi:hypothetical protein